MHTMGLNAIFSSECFHAFFAQDAKRINGRRHLVTKTAQHVSMEDSVTTGVEIAFVHLGSVVKTAR